MVKTDCLEVYKVSIGQLVVLLVVGDEVSIDSSGELTVTRVFAVIIKLAVVLPLHFRIGQVLVGPVVSVQI